MLYFYEITKYNEYTILVNFKFNFTYYYKRVKWEIKIVRIYFSTSVYKLITARIIVKNFKSMTIKMSCVVIYILNKTTPSFSVFTTKTKNINNTSS